MSVNRFLLEGNKARVDRPVYRAVLVRNAAVLGGVFAFLVGLQNSRADVYVVDDSSENPVVIDDTDDDGDDSLVLKQIADIDQFALRVDFAKTNPTSEADGDLTVTLHLDGDKTQRVVVRNYFASPSAPVEGKITPLEFIELADGNVFLFDALAEAGLDGDFRETIGELRGTPPATDAERIRVADLSFESGAEARLLEHTEILLNPEGAQAISEIESTPGIVAQDDTAKRSKAAVKVKAAVKNVGDLTPDELEALQRYHNQAIDNALKHVDELDGLLDELDPIHLELERLKAREALQVRRLEHLFNNTEKMRDGIVRNFNWSNRQFTIIKDNFLLGVDLEIGRLEAALTERGLIDNGQITIKGETTNVKQFVAAHKRYSEAFQKLSPANEFEAPLLEAKADLKRFSDGLDQADTQRNKWLDERNRWRNVMEGNNESLQKYGGTSKPVPSIRTMRILNWILFAEAMHELFTPYVAAQGLRTMEQHDLEGYEDLKKVLELSKDRNLSFETVARELSEDPLTLRETLSAKTADTLPKAILLVAGVAALIPLAPVLLGGAATWSSVIIASVTLGGAYYYARRTTDGVADWTRTLRDGIMNSDSPTRPDLPDLTRDVFEDIPRFETNDGLELNWETYPDFVEDVEEVYEDAFDGPLPNTAEMMQVEIPPEVVDGRTIPAVRSLWQYGPDLMGVAR